MVGLAHICLFGLMLGNNPIWLVKSVGSKFDFETKIEIKTKSSFGNRIKVQTHL